MTAENSKITRRLCISHFLSAWNARTFEFGAVLFLATIYPGTLLYASIYALLRSASATLLSSRVGSYVDRENRLISIRHSIIWQRASVIASCALFYVLLDFGKQGLLGLICFLLSIGLACVEKLASIGNTVAVERDWVVVICDNTDVDRGELNATLRRIDLFCKLIAPIFISFIDAYGAKYAVAITGALSAVSVGVEYIAIAQVYNSVPALGVRGTATIINAEEVAASSLEDTMTANQLRWSKRLQATLIDAAMPWITYTTSPIFLASFSLSLLYLTVLSTNVHWQTYMLAINYKPLTVSFFRVLAVISELAATCVAPILMDRIGPIRAGLWSINWQVLMLAPAVAFFWELRSAQAYIGGAALTAGMIASRLGLWSFDLSVQFIVQDRTPSDTRALFSSCEIALQNFFELLSFAATIVFPRPTQFAYPVFVSYGAIVLAAACFAAFVRKERGHLLHGSKCLGGNKKRGKYVPVEQVELEELEEQNDETAGHCLSEDD
jgi:iron-regulated transporter 1